MKLTALDPDGTPVTVAGGVVRGLRPGSRYTWVASVDGSVAAGGSFTTPPAALDGPVRFAVLGDYGSGDENEWAVGRLLAAQQPDFAVTAGDNSYLVAAEVLLDRNIFRPMGDLMRNAPMYVCLGDHDKFFPGPGALSSAFDLPEGGRFTCQPRPGPGRRARRRAQRSRRPSSSRARSWPFRVRPSASSPATARCRSATRSSR